jgi:hypothetical protein
MQQILKWAGGGQPFLDLGQGVFLLTHAQNPGFTVCAGIGKFEFRRSQTFGTAQCRDNVGKV